MIQFKILNFDLFGAVTTTEQLQSSSEGFVPPNIKANTAWAVNNFNTWADWRVAAQPNDPVPHDILTCGDASLINKWLSLYITETRKQNGDRYPSATFNLLLRGLKRHMKKVNPATPNLMMIDSLVLEEPVMLLHGSCEKRLLVLQKHTATIKFSVDEEVQLWSQGVMGVHIPKALPNAVFF